jgi:hypothetical protein
MVYAQARLRCVLGLVAVASLMAIGGLKLVSHRLSQHVNGTYDVEFSDGLFVGYLASQQYQGLRFVELQDEWPCFRDPSREFNAQNLGSRLRYVLATTHPRIIEPELIERADGSFCVPSSEIRHLFRDDQVVWESWLPPWD